MHGGGAAKGDVFQLEFWSPQLNYWVRIIPEGESFTPQPGWLYVYPSALPSMAGLGTINTLNLGPPE